MKRKSIIFLAILMLLMCSFTALAAGGDKPVELLSASFDGGDPLNLGTDYAVTLNNPLSPGDTGIRPRIVLEFSTGVDKDEYIEANAAKIHLMELTDSGELKQYVAAEVAAVPMDPGDTSNPSAIFVRPDAGLLDGYYKIEVEAGITSNKGSTEHAYEIFFTVGEPDSNPVDPGAKTITLNIQGIITNVSPIATFRQDKVQIYPIEGNTFSLAPGEYTYAVSATGYVTATGSYTVTEDAVIDITMIDHVFVTFYTTPSDARVRVKKGQNDFITPEADGRWKLSPGFEYTYVVDKEGYTLRSTKFTPVNDQEITTVLEEDPNYGPGYYEQGDGGNTLTMTNPGADKIEVLTGYYDEYYYNVITDAYEAGTDIDFSFTMSAGINNFNEDRFKTENLILLSVHEYAATGTVGDTVATSANGKLTYKGFDNRIITVTVAADVLEAGEKYVLRFDRDLHGNNMNKTLGKPAMFEFSIAGNTTPPVDPNPPVVDPPVDPNPPVVDPPVDPNPPVVDPPVDPNPPVVDPPVDPNPPVVNPPVITPPIITPPVILPPVVAPVEQKTINLTLGSVNADVNGEEKVMDVLPEVVQTPTGGVTFLPFRFIAELLGMSVNWDGATKTVTMIGGGNEVKLVLDSDKAIINGEEVQLLASIYAKSGRTLVPLRFLAEAVGCTVNFDNKTGAIAISNK